MSFYTDASLVLIPSGIKDQKVYCAKPVDGSGDLTFSRASNATRVNSSGLVEKVRENRVLYSNDFTNAAWIQFYTSVTAGETDPFGGTNATRYVSTGIGGYMYQNSVCVSGTEMTASVWVKSNTGSSQTFVFTANGGSSASSAFTATTSWQRVSYTFTSSSNGDILFGYNSVALVDLLIYGFQLETGVMTDYIPTTTTAVSVGPVSGLPRLDYSGGASCPALKLEPQRTNAQTFSEDLTQGSAFGTGSTSISANVTTSPDGYTNADKVVEDATTARHEVYGKSLAFSGTSSVSFFAKAAERRYLSAFVAGNPALGGATFDLQTGTITETSGGTTAKIEDYTNGWYRCSFTTTSTTTTTLYLCLRTNGGAPNVETYAGDGTSGLYIWGVQTEISASYPSSYINTLSTAVTRVGDDSYTASLQSASLIGATAGTFFIETTKTDDLVWVNQRIFLTSTLVRSLLLDTSAGQIRLRTWDASSVGTSITTSGLPNGPVKYLVKWDGTNVSVFANGALVGSSAQPSFAYTTYSSLESPSYSNNTLKQLLFFPTALTDAECITLTT
jgi:hypothetical protein